MHCMDTVALCTGGDQSDAGSALIIEPRHHPNVRRSARFVAAARSLPPAPAFGTIYQHIAVPMAIPSYIFRLIIEVAICCYILLYLLASHRSGKLPSLHGISTLSDLHDKIDAWRHHAPSDDAATLSRLLVELEEAQSAEHK